MSIKQLADDTAKEISNSLNCGNDKSDDISRIVEKALFAVLKEVQTECVNVVNICCNPDQDLAHKIARELRLKEKALIANLSSLR